MTQITKVQELRTKLQEKLHAATNHQFTADLCDGSLSDARLYTYLVQDQKFFLTSVRFLAKTMLLCDSDTAMITLGKQLALLCGDENTYFNDSLKVLKERGYDQPLPILPEVQEFLNHLTELIESDQYVSNIVAFYTFELVYLMWAEPHEKSVGHLEPIHKDWVYLHSGPAFTKWVQFLESEVARTVNDENMEVASREMERVLGLEYKFFEATYNYSL